MVAENITRAGEMLAEAWKTKTRLSQLPDDDVPADRTEAYAIQDIMAERLGLTVAGWKLGMSAPGTMLQFDVTEPVPGRIFEECIYADGAEIPAGGYSGPKVEPEFAVRLKSALPARSEPYAREEIVMATDAVLMCLEIADNRVFMEAPVPLTMIADNGGFAAYVVGPEVEDWQSVDYVGVPVDL
ncbi:MAG: hypothetical protein MI741_00765, partial [Rhodospirillales bacterium]|nr:hypothetical protein [Rhodospirillales bacterium]